MAKIRIDCDFNTRDERLEDVLINPEGSFQTSGHKREDIKDGDVVVLFDEEMEVEARIRWDEVFKMWRATPNWLTRRDI